MTEASYSDAHWARHATLTLRGEGILRDGLRYEIKIPAIPSLQTQNKLFYVIPFISTVKTMYD